MKGARKQLLNIGLPVLAVLVFVAVWWLAALAIGTELVLPSPAAVVKECGEMLASGSFWKSIGMSTLRALWAFALSLVLALVLGISAGYREGVARFLSPLVTLLRSVPTISVIFLVLVMLPSGQVPVLIGFLVVFPLLYEGTKEGCRSVDPDLVALSEVYRVPVSERIRKCYLPAMLPSLFSVCRSAIGLTLKVVIAAEAIAATGMSLGRLMNSAKVRLESGQLLAYTLAAIAVSFLLEGLVLLIRKLSLRWES